MMISTDRAKLGLLLLSLSSVMVAGACQSADAASVMTADAGFNDAVTRLCVSPIDSSNSSQSSELDATCL